METALYELIDPITGEAIDANDIDGIADAYSRVKEEQARLYRFTDLARAALAALDRETDADVVTRRLRGTKHRIKITMPDVSWEQKQLREIVAKFPYLADTVVQVERYKVALREWKKIEHETGSEEFNNFKAALQAACRGRVGLPTITIEE